MSDPDPCDVDRMLRELQEVWGTVYVAYKGPRYYDGKECTIRNTTDEGLPAGSERKRVDASTFTEALRKAHRQYVGGGHGRGRLE